MRHLLAAMLFVYGCGDDSASAPDATVVDASVVDAALDSALPDAFVLCPGKTILEVELVDLVTQERIEQTITIAEVGTENVVDAAPNGRGILCVPSNSPSVVRFASAGYLPRTHAVSPAIAAANYSSGAVYRIELAKAADADALVAGSGGQRDALKSLVRIDVRTYPTGAGVAGVSFSTTANFDGSFIQNADGIFESSSVSDNKGTLWLTNYDADSTAGAELSVSGGCTATVVLPVQAGGLASVLHACL